MTNGISELHFASVRQTGCNDAFCDPTSHISSRAIHFARVFPGESAAAVASHSAVSIDNNFATRDPGIALRPTDHETPGRIDQVSCLSVEPFGRHHIFDQQ